MKKENFDEFVNHYNEFYKNVVTEDVPFKLFILDFFDKLKLLDKDSVLDFLRCTSLSVRENKGEGLFSFKQNFPYKDEYLRKLFLCNISDIRIRFCKEYIIGGNTDGNC